jgi:hypothetical protein
MATSISKSKTVRKIVKGPLVETILCKQALFCNKQGDARDKRAVVGGRLGLNK